MAVVRYVSDGRKAPMVNISYSMNNGRSWQSKDLIAGQAFPIPPNCTNLLMENVPYDPKGNFEIRQGKVASK